MNINVSSNFKNGRWNGIKNHVNRNYLHSENKKIRSNLSKFNTNLSQTNSKILIEQHFKKFVKKHDKKVKEQGHPKREYKSVKNYIKRRKGLPTSNVVIKFGTMKDKTLLKKKYGSKKIIKADNLGFKIYASQFNKRHLYIELAEAETNVDEQGADHLHYNLVCLGHTKKGKPSMGLSNALRCEYKTSNRILAMKKFHQDDDKFLINCMNYSYHKIVNPKIHFNLTRTHKALNLNEKVYEKSEAKKKRLENASKLQNKRIKAIKPTINKSKQQIKKPIPKYIKIIHKIKIRIRSIGRRIIKYIETPSTNTQSIKTNISQNHQHHQSQEIN